MTRVPRQAADLVMEEAARLGISYSEYIAFLVSNGVGLKAELPQGARDSAQRELPLQTAS